MDPFETLGIPPRFDLDMPELEARHRELSRALHPDRHAGKPPAERRQALGKAIEANEAFRMLKDPLTRARALLARLGHAVAEGAESKPKAELLMDMMEQREALAEIRQTRDEKALQNLSASIEARRGAALEALTAQFDRGPELEPAETNALLGELRYYARFLEEAGAIADELF